MSIDLIIQEGQPFLARRTEIDFWASDHFEINDPRHEINMIWVGDYFRKNFMTGERDKGEPARQAQYMILPFRLSQNALGRQILLSAQQERLKPVQLVDVYNLVVQQVKMEIDVLDMNGRKNFFFVNDNQEQPQCHIVHVKYSLKWRGWGIGGYPIIHEEENEAIRHRENAAFTWYAGSRWFFKEP
ncbi:MAG: hypothetical protein K9M11_01335 [Candidatus Pacebacteria bacterium]|nr:hypothetical protein [Candidatus Paceibacterota bacterium]